MCKKVLVISPSPFHPQDAGNRTRIHNLLINLQKLGHEVHFLHIQQETDDDFQMSQVLGKNFYSIPYIRPSKGRLPQKVFRKLRCFITDYPIYPYAVDDWYDNSINKFLVTLQKRVKFDVVIVEYVFFSKALKYFSKNVLKIIDTHDIFNNRRNLYKNNGQEYHWYSTTLKEEIKGLQRSDFIIAIQKQEEEYFKKLVRSNVITVGHTVSLREPQYIQNHNYRILYIASHNENNIHGINYFITQVLPKVKSSIPDLQLLIAGKVCEGLDEDDAYTKLGYVSNIDKVYDAANVVINPILFGTGLKIKSVEALGQSKVLVTTPEGAKGLEIGANKAFLIAKNPDEFVQCLIEVFTDTRLSYELSKNAYSFAKNYNNAAFEPLAKILT